MASSSSQEQVEINQPVIPPPPPAPAQSSSEQSKGIGSVSRNTLSTFVTNDEVLESDFFGL